MREIKFRGKFKSDGLWEYGSLWIDKDKYYINGTDNNWWEVIPETVGQYTGLKDKNGVEIYEGDIVCDRWANFYTPIFRNGIYMAYNVKDLHLTKQEPSTQFNVIWKNGCEVIGNIYEDKDLLEEIK